MAAALSSLALATGLATALALLPAPAQESPPGEFDDFPVFVWRQDFHGEELPASLFAPFGGVNVEGDGEVPKLEGGAALEFYVGHAPGREELHLRRTDEWYAQMWERWYEDRETARLVRQPCLSEEATREAMLARLAKNLAARGGEHGRAVSLGDEVGLTPAGDPLDLCHSESCRTAWGEAPWPATDDVRLAWLDGDTSLVGPWLERRRFHSSVVHELLETLAARTRQLAPDSPVALYGVKTRTAFGGVDVARLLPRLDWIEPYSDTVSRELCFTLRGREQRVLATIFPADDRPDRAALRLWEHVLRGGDGAVIWSDRHLARSPSYHERLARAVRHTRETRAWLRELLGEDWRPTPSGWAIVEDSDAVALAFLRDALGDGPTWPRRFAGYQVVNGTRERAVDAWLDALEDAGRLPGALPFEGLDEAASRRFPVWVLVEQALLSPADEQRLARHLAGGGALVVVGRFAEFDRTGEARTSPLESWRELHGERVVRAEVGAPSSPARIVRELTGLVPLPGSRLRVETPEDPTLRVLRVRQEIGPGRAIVALLPRPARSETPVAPVRLLARANSGWKLRSARTGRRKMLLGDADALDLVLGAGDPLFVLLDRD